MVRHGINTAQCDDETIQCEKKNNGTTKCDKSTVISDASNAQYDSRTVKCEKKKKDSTKCDKSTIRFDVGIA